LKSFESQSKECEQLRESSLRIAPISAKQDARIEELSSTVMDLRLKLENISHENSQLLIEKEVWKSSKARALAESQELLSERNSANQRLAELQRTLESKDHLYHVNNNKLEKKLDETSQELYIKII
jgi:hypothetical protein